MIKEKELKVKISSRNSYLRDKYKCEYGDEIMVKVEDISKNSHYKITAICEECGIETEIMIHKYHVNKQRQGYYGCKKCSRKKFKLTNQELFGCDNPSQNDKVKLKRENTCIEKYGVKTTLIESETKKKIDKTNLELYGNECFLKSDARIENVKNKIIENFDKNFKLIDLIGGVIPDKYIYEIECEKGHNFKINSTMFYQRCKWNTIVCTVCNPIGSFSQSGYEIQLFEFIKNNYDGKIITSDRQLIVPQEIDIYLPDLKLGFEFNGNYWHCDLYKEKNYHKNKTDKCINKGVHLVQIYEDEWIYKQDIVKSRILNLLGKSNRIYARKCQIKEVQKDRDFLVKNHIQGFVGSAVKLGLYYQDELVSLMTFGKRRKFMNMSAVDGEYEMLRFCNKLNFTVIGGANRLFQNFIKNYKPEKIFTFADKSWSQGNLYEKLGFKHISDTSPNYYYFKDDLKRIHRFNFRKDKLIRDGFDPNKTEYQIMMERNYYRIYDSGNKKYEISF